VFVDDPFALKRITLMIDVNGGTFDKDLYIKWWDATDGIISDPNPPTDDGGGEEELPILI
jgi:hypothetical protein